MRPESWVAALVTMHTLSPVALVWLMVPSPLPCVMPPLAAKFQPDAAVVPPFMPVVPVPHVAPVPEISATLFAAAVTRLREEIRTCRPETPVMRSVVVAVETLTLTKLSATGTPVRKPPVAPDPSPPMKLAAAGGAAPVALLETGLTRWVPVPVAPAPMVTATPFIWATLTAELASGVTRSLLVGRGQMVN